MRNVSTSNYYEILEVPPHASQTDIASAYQRARQTYSLNNPVLFEVFSEEEAKAWIHMIDEAFQVIGHPESREVYNQELSAYRRVVPANLSAFQPEARDGFAAPATGPGISSEDQRQVPIADGEARTSISTYAIQPAVEDYIAKEEIFDGLFLKKIRVYKNVDQQAFSSKTCIALRHIYAIENNNFSVLPAAVFVRGYIIQYCRILGLDEQRVVPSFMSLFSDEKRTSY